LYLPVPWSIATLPEDKTKESNMIAKRILILATFAAIVSSAGAAQAGPCNTTGTSANRDAGSGPTVGATGQTTGAAQTTDAAQSTSQHPPTAGMNRATDDVAASSQDAQNQMQGHPTAAQQAEGVHPSTTAADQGC